MKNEKRFFGSIHLLLSKSKIADSLSNLGNLSEAHRLNLEIFEKRTNILTGDHPDTFVSKFNIALLYSRLGKYSQTLRIHEEVFQKRHTFANILKIANILCMVHRLKCNTTTPKRMVRNGVSSFYCANNVVKTQWSMISVTQNARNEISFLLQFLWQLHNVPAFILRKQRKQQNKK